MTALRLLKDGLLWLRPIPNWTLAVTVLLVAMAAGWAILVTFGVTTVAKAPGEVAIAFYQDAHDGEYEKAKRWLSEDAKLEAAKLLSSQWIEMLDGFSHDRTMADSMLLGIRNYGSHAVVGILHDFDDRDFDLRVDLLVKEGIRWRLEWPIGTRKFQATVDMFEPTFRGTPTPTPAGNGG